MHDATLRILEALREAHDLRRATTRALVAFGCLVRGEELPARTRARRIGDRRAALDAFRAVYREASRMASAEAAVASSGALAIESLFAIPPVERAVLALSSIVGLPDEDIAFIVDRPATDVSVLLERAVTTVRDAASAERTATILSTADSVSATRRSPTAA